MNDFHSPATKVYGWTILILDFHYLQQLPDDVKKLNIAWKYSGEKFLWLEGTRSINRERQRMWNCRYRVRFILMDFKIDSISKILMFEDNQKAIKIDQRIEFNTFGI